MSRYIPIERRAQTLDDLQTHARCIAAEFQDFGVSYDTLADSQAGSGLLEGWEVPAGALPARTPLMVAAEGIFISDEPGRVPGRPVRPITEKEIMIHGAAQAIRQRLFALQKKHAVSAEQIYRRRQYDLQEMAHRTARVNKLKRREKRWMAAAGASALVPFVAAAALYSSPWAKNYDRVAREGGDIYALAASMLLAGSGLWVSGRQSDKSHQISQTAVPIAQRLGLPLPLPMQECLDAKTNSGLAENT